MHMRKTLQCTHLTMFTKLFTPRQIDARKGVSRVPPAATDNDNRAGTKCRAKLACLLPAYRVPAERIMTFMQM